MEETKTIIPNDAALQEEVRKGNGQRTMLLSTTLHSLGRIFRLQVRCREAIGKDNRGWAPKFFRACCDRPATYMGPLTIQTVENLQALRRTRPELADWFDRKLTDAYGHVEVDCLTELSGRRMSTAEKHDFMRGYWQKDDEEDEEDEVL